MCTKLFNFNRFQKKEHECTAFFLVSYFVSINEKVLGEIWEIGTFQTQILKMFFSYTDFSFYLFCENNCKK